MAQPQIKQGVVNIRGKEYRTVALRVHDFRNDVKFKGHGLLTSILYIDDVMVRMRAEVTDAEGRIVATGHAEEIRASGNINRTSAVENCETSAIGRALASLGLAGTEFASANEVMDAMQQQKPCTASQAAAVQAFLDKNVISAGHMMASFGHADPSKLFTSEADKIINAVKASQQEKK